MQTGINEKSRKTVLERDSWDGHACCIFCGSPYRLELAHYVSRARGGKGIPENLVVLCHICHSQLDNGSNVEKSKEIKRVCEDRLKRFYPDWKEKEQIYVKSV